MKLEMMIREPRSSRTSELGNLWTFSGRSGLSRKSVKTDCWTPRFLLNVKNVHKKTVFSCRMKVTTPSFEKDGFLCVI